MGLPGRGASGYEWCALGAARIHRQPYRAVDLSDRSLRQCTTGCGSGSTLSRMPEIRVSESCVLSLLRHKTPGRMSGLRKASRQRLAGLSKLWEEIDGKRKSLTKPESECRFIVIVRGIYPGLLLLWGSSFLEVEEDGTYPSSSFSKSNSIPSRNKKITIRKPTMGSDSQKLKKYRVRSPRRRAMDKTEHT